MEFEKVLNTRAFFESWEWCELRYQTLQERGYDCECCGLGRDDGAIITVDHVLPRSIWPEYALDPGNLQVLCLQCNRGKSNRDTTDFRMRRFKKATAANDSQYQLVLPLGQPP